VYTCPLNHKTVTRDMADGVTPMFLGCKHEGCDKMASSCMYTCDQEQAHTHEWYKPENINKVPRDLQEHVKLGGLILRKTGEVRSDMHAKSFKNRLADSFKKKDPAKPELKVLKIGDRMWHRVFGWVTITHPIINNKTLVDSDYKHIEIWTDNSRWLPYKGDNGGKITSIFLPVTELFLEEQKDAMQAEVNKTKKIIA
jgi:hypothetical protein